jgi:hypothetical protein
VATVLIDVVVMLVVVVVVVVVVVMVVVDIVIAIVAVGTGIVLALAFIVVEILTVALGRAELLVVLVAVVAVVVVVVVVTVVAEVDMVVAVLLLVTFLVEAAAGMRVVFVRFWRGLLRAGNSLCTDCADGTEGLFNFSLLRIRRYAADGAHCASSCDCIESSSLSVERKVFAQHARANQFSLIICRITRNCNTREWNGGSAGKPEIGARR